MRQAMNIGASNRLLRFEGQGCFERHVGGGSSSLLLCCCSAGVITCERRAGKSWINHIDKFDIKRQQYSLVRLEGDV
jgi:hypothetical protein